MSTKRKSSRKPQLVNNPFVRVGGQSTPAQQVLQQAAQSENLPLVIYPGVPATVDYSLLDPALAVTPPPTGGATTTLPPTGAGYAAFTPTQRYMLLQWLNEATEPAPPAFQQFYLAHLEVRLLEPPWREQVVAEVQRLQDAPAWRQHLGLARLRLLTHWLAQDGTALVAWLGMASVPGALLGVALGLQALLNQSLQPQQLPLLFQGWSLPGLPSQALLTLRLSSLTATLGRDPLAYALAQLGEKAQHPQPWRAQHRDLRFALPQPDLRPVLEPLLRELTAMQEDGASAVDADRDETTEDDPAAPGWQLVLEFGESRSDFFEIALGFARKLPGYLALMDEDRHLIHRIHFKKGEVRHFWRLWEYVQSWSSAKVYLNGDEVNKVDLYGRLWHVR